MDFGVPETEFTPAQSPALRKRLPDNESKVILRYFPYIRPPFNRPPFISDKLQLPSRIVFDSVSNEQSNGTSKYRIYLYDGLIPNPHLETFVGWINR